ncbi:MAG: glycosyltransferase [Gammaproteobacteria bacterium]|nr:glycosyltransferase [Gammaproteobacteria bacterium]
MNLEPLRVVIAHCRYQQRGGEDAVVDAETQLLQQHGHQVRRLLRDNYEIEGANRAAVALQTLWSERTRREAQQLLQDFRPHVIHVHNTFPLLSPALYWAAARAGVPVVQTLHNFRLLCAQAMLLKQGKVCEKCIGHLPWRGVLGKCYRDSTLQSAVMVSGLALHRVLGTYQKKVTRYIALNEFCRGKFIDGGLPPERIVVKPNFVDIPAQESQMRKGGLFVGRLSSEKGTDILLAALSRLPDAHVDVIGTGPEQAKLEGRAGVRLLGWQEPNAVYARMRRAAYLVMPSLWYENFPRTLVEAFACGLPVIASRLGSMAELIDDRRTGLLFEAGSATDLARCIAWAEAHPEQLRQWGENARFEYKTKFTPEQNYRELTQIYQEVMDAHSY